LKSTYKEKASLDLSQLVVDEVTLVGSRCGPFQPALKLLASGEIDPTSLIDGQYPLEEGVAAFSRAAEPGTLKILLEMGTEKQC
jgi:threonine dehydrogenase-like Zn-dependent dehydrogenase